MSTAYISGIAGRFPKSNNLHEFWENLINGVDMLGPTRWPPGLYGLPPRSGTIPNLGTFDSDYFGYAENEARNSNLLLRVLLEVIYEGVVDSGFTLTSLRSDRTGLYLACTFSDGDAIATSSVLDSSHTNLRSSLLQRLVDWYKFQGPMMTVDTACSSSLSALQMAVTDLNAGRCNYAVVTGINLIVSPNCSQCFNQLSMLSPTGDSHVFDVSANGYVRSDGVGVVILTRIPDICTRIYASIADIAVNCDGHKEEGIVYPSRRSQCSLLKSLYGDNLIPSACLAYVEAHGTGTQAGDKLELNALMDALCEGRDDPLLVGSVKSNMGHCEAASGLAGLMKCILSVHHGVIPPNLHYKSPNLGIEGIPLGKVKIVDTLQPLKGRINVIGVNSFGFGGVNGHVVLMSYKNPRDEGEDACTYLVPVTARSSAGVDKIRDFLEKHADNVGLLSLLSKSLLSRDPRQVVRAYATVHVHVKEAVRATVTYTIGVATGDKLGAGTDSNVFIDLQGDLGKSGRIGLKKSVLHRNKWERGNTDEFLIETKDIGHLKRITIGHDNKGVASSWFLDHVTVNSSALQHTWTVPCGRWLAKDEDDGLIARELLPLESSIVQEKNNVNLRWSPLPQSSPPVWLLLQDVAWCHNVPDVDLLKMEVFRKSVQESDKILNGLSSDIAVEEAIKSGTKFKSPSKVGLVCSVVTSLGLVDLLKISSVPLDGYIGSGLSEIIVAHLDGCLTHSQCLQVALAVGDVLDNAPNTDLVDYSTYAISLHPELAYKLGPKTRILSYVSDNGVLAAIPRQNKDYILRMLQQTGGVYMEVMDQVCIYTKLADEAVRRLEKTLSGIIPAPRKRSDKFRSCSDSNSPVDKESLCGPSYISNLLQTTVNQFQTVSSLPRGTTVMSLCISNNCSEHEVSSTLCELSEIHCHPNTKSLLQSLGEIHLLGHAIDVDHLYTHVPLPVDCSTPPLSPLVEWNHNIKWPLPDWCQFSARVKDMPKEVYQISMADLDSSVYDPLALLLFHAWSAVSVSKGNLQPTVLDSFTTNPELMFPEYLHGAYVYVHQGRKTFTILTCGGVVMTGNYDLPEGGPEIPLLPGYDVDVNENVAKAQDDCDTDVETQEVLWEDSWLDFLNATLEFVNPNTQSLPTKVMVNPEKHLTITHECASVLVMYEESTGICKAGALVLQFPAVIKPSVDQSILFQNMSDSSSRFLVEHLLLYSLQRNIGVDDKLLLYRACQEDNSEDTVGFISINNDGVKYKSYITPSDWQTTDLEAVVPFVIASHTLEQVARVSNKESVLVLPPLDTVSVYIIAMLADKDHNVFTSTWDPEINLMLENAFPKVRILNPKNLVIKIKQLTSGRGVDLCFKTDGSDMDWTLDLLADHGRCIQMGRPSPKDTLGMAAFLRNITVTTSNTASVIRHQLDMTDDDFTASLETLISSKIRNRSEDGYPEPRGIGYSLEEQLKFKQPISLQGLLTLLDGPGFKAKDVLDGFPDKDIVSLERLQEKLVVKPQEYSLAQNDLSYLCDSKEQFNIARLSPYMESSRVCTPYNCSGLLAPPNTRCTRMSVDLSQYTSASTPIIRITLDPPSPTRRDPLASLDLKVAGLRLESSYTDEKVFSSPAPSSRSTLLGTPKTTDLVFLGTPKSPLTPLTPSSPAVKRLLTPSKLTPVLVKLNTCNTNGRPLFIVHPITGTLNLLKALGEKLKIPCYGVQRTNCTPTSSVSAIAGFYRNAIELQSPTGPYRLAGYSYGGMIAFEIARQMQKSDIEVECLIILDGGPGYVHSQIAIGRNQLTRDTSEATSEDVIETVALMSFIEMYEPLKERDCIRGVLETLPSKYARIRMAVDYLMGKVVVSQSQRKTKWLSLKERVLQKDTKPETKLDVLSVATEVIRLSREKKAEEYINSTRLADKYRPRDNFAGDIHLLRVKCDPSLSVPIHADYGLGPLCTGEVKITYVDGDHQSFLRVDSVGAVADHIHTLLATHKH